MEFSGTGDVVGEITGGAMRYAPDGQAYWDFYDQQANVLTSVPYTEFLTKYAPVNASDWAWVFGSVNGVPFHDWRAKKAEPVIEPADLVAKFAALPREKQKALLTLLKD